MIMVVAFLVAVTQNSLSLRTHMPSSPDPVYSRQDAMICDVIKDGISRFLFHSPKVIVVLRLNAPKVLR